MKRYFQYFKWFFVAIGAVTLITIIAMVGVGISNQGKGGRTNTAVLTEERVFDHADVLTPEEEGKLRELIAKNEKLTGCDIVLVTLNESLEEFALMEGESVPESEYVRVFAEAFYDEQLFGYDKPDGDGIILVDNWFREKDGMAYTWISTAGKAVDYYTYTRTEYMLDQVYEYIETDPYLAYEAYINQFLLDMAPEAAAPSGWAAFLVALISAGIFMGIHLGRVRGSKTTLATTYVNGGKPMMNKNEDILLDKKVVVRVIERADHDSNSGGGGSSGGSGGGGHGGGGRGR